MSEIESLTVLQDRIAKVVMNERTGTIVAGGNVQISEIMVSHGNLTIHTRRTPVISQPAPFARRSRTVVEGITSTTVFGKGMSSDMYHSMFDENIAQAIASKDGFGLSDIIIKSLHKDSGQEESAPGETLADYWLRPI